MADWLLGLGDVILIAAAIGATVFAISYGSFFNWRRTEAGRALMYFVLSLIAVFVNNTAARLMGTDYPYREWVRLAVYIVVAWTIWRLVFVLWRNWRADRPPFELDAKTRNSTKE